MKAGKGGKGCFFWLLIDRIPIPRVRTFCIDDIEAEHCSIPIPRYSALSVIDGPRALDSIS